MEETKQKIQTKQKQENKPKNKKISEVFSDYSTNSNIKYAQIEALNLIKKENTLKGKKIAVIRRRSIRLNLCSIFG